MKVYQAINKVQRALSAEGISKDRRNQQQGYSFRGIDDVLNALSPLLGMYGLCVLPRVISRECTERQSAKGGTIFNVVCEVEFDFVCTDDGSKHVVKTYGEAMDSADKATNKAMSAAYKYAAIQAFAIPTEGDNDADAHTPEVRPGMPEDRIADWIAVIEDQPTAEDVKTKLAEAKGACEHHRDKAAYARIVAAAKARAEALKEAA